MSDEKFEELTKKPLWQMTGEEFLELVRKSGLQTVPAPEAKSSNDAVFDMLAANTYIEQATGMTELSVRLGCCKTKIFELKQKGVFNDAIVNYVGRKCVFDVPKARTLMRNYYECQANA